MSVTAAELPRRIGIEGYLAIAALCYAAAGATFSWSSYTRLLTQYSVTHFYVLPPVLFIGLIVTSIIASPSKPLAWLKELLRDRGAAALTTIIIFCFAIASFSTFKHHIPAWLPFFADAPIADLDDLLHFGQPWRYLHQITPDTIGPLLGVLYGPGWFAEWLGVILVAAFLRNRRDRVRYLLAFSAIIVLLGTVLRAAMASCGPIFYDRMFGGARFADMMQALSTTTAGASMLKGSDYLHASYLGDDAVFGTGIAAMPSIHVAMAVLNAIFLSSLNRWLGVFGWTFAAAIMWGSVYFGWHYALDGYVSIVCVILIWRWATTITKQV